MNVVTLLPSATEIVYALGVEPVGVSHECDYPPAAREQPAVNFSRVDPDAESADINEQVAQAERDGGVYGIYEDVLADLEPDLIVTQGICDVCAVDSVLVEAAVEELETDPEILTTDPHSLEDVFEDIRAIGRALGREQRATELLSDLQSRVEAVEEAVADVESLPRVAVLDWLDPVMVAGHWIPEMIERAGGRYDLESHRGRSRPREWDEIRRYDPDVIVAAPCGFGLERTRSSRRDLTALEGWDDLRAVRDGRVYAMDGHHYVNRPGPRLVETLEYLAALVHPDRFDTPPSTVACPFSERLADRP